MVCVMEVTPLVASVSVGVGLAESKILKQGCKQRLERLGFPITLLKEAVLNRKIRYCFGKGNDAFGA